MSELGPSHENVVALRPDAGSSRSLEVENAQPRQALRSRVVIEQAKGAISARFGTEPDVAFELMRGLARSQRRNLQEYAAEIVANRGRLG